MPRILLLFVGLLTLTAGASAQLTGAVSCKSSWPKPGTYPVLKLRELAAGKLEYYGRFRMWSPIGDVKECHIRQLVFNVGRLKNDLPKGAPNGPILTFTVEHNGHPAKEMTVDPNMSIEPNGSGFVQYTVDARSVQSKPGVYFARISVVGTAP